MLVVEVHEILDGVDIAERNRLIIAKALPVIQGVAVVAQDRRSLQQPEARQSGAARFAGNTVAGS